MTRRHKQKFDSRSSKTKTEYYPVENKGNYLLIVKFSYIIPFLINLHEKK